MPRAARDRCERRAPGRPDAAGRERPATAAWRWRSHDRSIALNVFAPRLARRLRRAQAGARDARLRRPDRPRPGLLEAPGTAAWVLWRLDGGLDHILLDEAQDTSPGQWRVIAGDLRRVLRRRRGPRRRSHHFRRRRREAVDLQLPGRRPGRVRSQARALRTRCSRTSARRCSAATCSIRSARHGRSCGLSTRCSPARPARASTGTWSITPMGRPAGPGRAVAVLAQARTGRRRVPGTSRRKPRPPSIPSRPWRCASQARSRGWLAERPAAAGREGWPGDPAPATSWCWCSAAARSSTR